RELREQGALLDEVLEQVVAHVGRRIHQSLEALDGDRLLPDLVHRAVDDAEPSLPDDRLDVVLFSDGRPDDVERIVMLHGSLVDPGNVNYVNRGSSVRWSSTLRVLVVGSFEMVLSLV